MLIEEEQQRLVPLSAPINRVLAAGQKQARYRKNKIIFSIDAEKAYARNDFTIVKELAPLQASRKCSPHI